MPDCLNSSSAIGAGQWVTWTMIFVGWLVINWQNNKREDRKEVRAIIDGLKENIYFLEENAIHYHTTEDVTPKESNKIKWDIQRVISDFEIHDLVDEQPRANAFKSLRKAITLFNFESLRHEAYPSDHEVIIEIHNSVDDLVGLLEKDFRGRYPLKGLFSRRD